ncbi:hypothetical protein D918_00969 [Trichuris suis]|nr:hypothetical protein D918_00969 [Trichuris suis]
MARGRANCYFADLGLFPHVLFVSADVVWRNTTSSSSEAGEVGVQITTSSSSEANEFLFSFCVSPVAAELPLGNTTSSSEESGSNTTARIENPEEQGPGNEHEDPGGKFFVYFLHNCSYVQAH